jgi:DNA-directed RNA polymerase subunit RPC12/RpoP
VTARIATPGCFACERDPGHGGECLIVIKRYVTVARVCSTCGGRFNLAGRRNATAKRCPDCRAAGGAR